MDLYAIVWNEGSVEDEDGERSHDLGCRQTPGGLVAVLRKDAALKIGATLYERGNTGDGLDNLIERSTEDHPLAVELSIAKALMPDNAFADVLGNPR